MSAAWLPVACIIAVAALLGLYAFVVDEYAEHGAAQMFRDPHRPHGLNQWGRT